MQSPIPDPFSAPVSTATTKAPRPPALIWLLGSNYLLSICTALVERPPVSIVLFGLAYLISFLFSYALYMGKNWARLLMVIFGPLSLFSLIAVPWQDPLLAVMKVGGIVFSLYWVFYLTRPEVVRFFKGTSSY